MALLHVLDRLNFNPFLQALINFFISFEPLVDGLFIIALKYFSNTFLLSYIIFGFLFVFFKICVLGN
jgi:hypothetical protein